MQITVLNPNSSTSVTASMDRALAPLKGSARHQIHCTEIASAPIGIESDAEVALAAELVTEFASSSDADALVVACFSDPGVEVMREKSGAPVVIGIAEAAYYAALQHGKRFGIISLGDASIIRHRDHVARLGLTQRCAGDRPLKLSVAEANNPDIASKRVVEVAKELRDLDGADVLILGCAGLAEQRIALQEAVGCVVIDPVQAATAAAVTALDLSYTRKDIPWNV